MAGSFTEGTAGGSARREYERRRTKDEQRIRDDWGRFGGIAVALTPERQSTRAWNSGAGGETRVGAKLDALASETIRVLHDRRIPGSRANIDHLVVTTNAVWVIDAKRYVEKRPELRVEGGIFRPRTEKLVLGGRDRTPLAAGVLGQADKVRAVVGDVAIVPVLCFVDADWPLIGGSFRVNGVEVLWPNKLAERIRSDRGTLDPSEIAGAIGRRFPQA